MTTKAPRNITVMGFSPGLFGSAAAEATTLDVGPGQVRDITNAGPDDLLVHGVAPDGQLLGDPVTIRPHERGTIDQLSKLASPGRANVTVYAVRAA